MWLGPGRGRRRPRPGGGGGDGSVLAGEGNGAASRMADAGTSGGDGGDGGVEKVYGLSHGPGEPDGAPAGGARARPGC